MRSKSISISLCLLIVMSVFVSAASMNAGNGSGSSGSPTSNGDSADANGPYGTQANPRWEGEDVDFSGTVINPTVPDYQMTWDIDGDGIVDYTKDVGTTFDVTHHYTDNFIGEAEFTAWDGFSYKEVLESARLWDEPENPPTYLYTGPSYMTHALKFEVYSTTTVDQIGVYRHYSTRPYWFYNVRLWTSSEDLLTSVDLDSEDQPGEYEWSYIDLPSPQILYPGIYYVSTYCYGYAYYGDYNPGPTPDGVLDPDWWMYYPGNDFPKYAYSADILPWIDFKYSYKYYVPDALTDCADVLCQNVAPVVTDCTAVPDWGYEGAAATFTAMMTDPGTCDEWWYKWYFGDGTSTGWLPVNKIGGNAKVLLLHTYAKGEIDYVMDNLARYLGGFATVLDEIDAYTDGTPEWDDIKDYDVIVVGSNYAWLDSYAIGNMLADFSDQGGGVVELPGSWYYNSNFGIYGRWRNQNYNTMEPSGTSIGQHHLGPIYEKNHIALEGVEKAGCTLTHESDSVTSGATRLADWDNDEILLAYTDEDHHTSGGGRIMGVNIFPLSGYTSGDAYKIIANSIMWVSGYAYYKTMPIELDPVSHAYMDDDPTHVTPIDLFEAILMVRDDDDDKYILWNPFLIVSEDFESASWPTGWYETGDMGWYVGTSYMGTGYAARHGYYSYPVTSTLYSSVYDFTGLYGAIIDWDNYWRAEFPGSDSYGRFEVTTDGWLTWYTLAEFNHLNPGLEQEHYQVVYPEAAGNFVQFRWVYYNYNDWFWEFDNFEVRASDVYPMDGYFSVDTTVQMSNVFPTAVIPPELQGKVVAEGEVITFSGIELDDPAIFELTEKFWYRFIWDDGSQTGWMNKGCAVVSDPDVLLIHGLEETGNRGDSIDPLIRAIQSLPNHLIQLDLWNILDEEAAPSLPTMEQYDVVIWGTYYERTDDLYKDLGDVLADYVDYGGSVITLWPTYDLSGRSLRGRYMDDDYGPFERELGSPESAGLGNILDPNHPVMLGVGTIFSGEAHSGDCTPTEGAEVLAEWRDGNPAIAVKEHPSGGKTAHVGMAFNEKIWGDYMQLMTNSILWAITDHTLDLPSHSYMDAGTYNIVLQMIDDDMWWDLSGPTPVYVGPVGEEDSWISHNELVIEVLETDLVVDLGPDVTIDEGDTVILGATVTNFDGDTDTLWYEWFFGDGQYVYTKKDKWAKPYYDDGSYTVTVKVYDDDDNYLGSGSMIVTAQNVAPDVDIGDDFTLNEGEIKHFSAGVVDPGYNILTYFWTFGDGATSTEKTPQHSYKDDGTFTVDLTVTDDKGAVGSDSIVVTSANVAPIVSLSPPMAVDEGDTLIFHANVYDPGDDLLSYFWEFGDGETSTEEKPEHTYPDDGSFTVTVTVTDDDGGVGSDSLVVNVDNVAPIVSLSPDMTVEEGETLIFDANVYDLGDDSLSYFWEFGDGTTSTEEKPEHTYEDDGTFTVTLTVTDDDGGVGSDSMVVTVDNVTPGVDIGDDRTIEEGDTIHFSASVTDPGDDVLTYLWDFGDGATSTEENPEHTYMDDGTFTVTLTVTDDDGAVGSDSMVVTVDNVAPIVSLGPDMTIDEGETLSFGANVHDPGADMLSYFWDFGDGETSTEENPEHTYMDDGTFTVTLTVTDDDGAFGFDSMVVTVQNVAPSVNLGADVIINEGEMMHFSASVTDPGDDVLTYLWDFGDGATSTEENPQHIYGDDGVFTVTLMVTDDDGDAGSDTMIVTVLNVAPIVNAGDDMTINEGSTVSFGATIYDPGDDTHTYAWDFGDGGTSSDPNPIHTYLDNGVYTVTLTVTDDDGDETTDSLIVTVLNVAPTASLGADFTIDEGVTVPLNVIATDPGPLDTLTIEWDLDDDGLYDDATGQSVSWNGDDDGDYTVSVRVTDNDGGVGTDHITITVNNVAPSLSEIILPFEIDEGSLGTFQASAEDDGSDDLTFTWVFELGPTISNTYYNDGMGPDPYPSPGGTSPFSASDSAEHTYGDNGVYTVTLTIEDDDGGLTTYTTTITVNNVAPTIQPLGPFTIDEGQSLDLTALCSDVGSDDLTVTCEFELGPTVTNVHYNDGLGPDPNPSPWGTCPFTVSEIVSHSYGDNGIYLLTLTVEDDDGGSCTYITTVTVNNVAPTITLEAYMYVDFTLRVSGEKWHNVEMFIYEDDDQIGYTEVWRNPGDPDEQSMVIPNVKCDLTKTLTAKIVYSPFDDPLNGGPKGADKAWVTLTFEDGTEETFQHNFNVNHPDRWEWIIDINQHLGGHEITFDASATDQGSDDLTFTWDFGDGRIDTSIFFNDGLNPDPIQSPWGTCPFTATDTKTHKYTKAGSYTFTLTVSDDDGGTADVVINIILN